MAPHLEVLVKMDWEIFERRTLEMTGRVREVVFSDSIVAVVMKT